jgi:hypothetical protein
VPGFEGDKGGIDWDLLALLDVNCGNATADFGTNLDLASFDGAGVGEGPGMVAEEVVEERKDQDGYGYDREDDLRTLQDSSGLLGVALAEGGFCKWHTK